MAGVNIFLFIMDISLNLRRLRELKNISQTKVAKEIGINRTTYNSYETGIATPPLENLVKIANLLGVTLDELAGLSGVSSIKASSSNIINRNGNNGNRQSIKTEQNQDKIKQLQEKIHHLERENQALQQTIHTQNKLIQILEQK